MRKRYGLVTALTLISAVEIAADQPAHEVHQPGRRSFNGSQDCQQISAPGTFKQFNYQQQIQPIFSNNCAPCHISGSSAQLSLTPANSYLQLVNITAVQVAQKRVDPGSPETSFLFAKINCDTPAGFGSRMPQGSDPLSLPQMTLIFDWIKAGSPDLKNGFE